MKASGSTRSMLHAVQTTYSEKTYVSLSNSTKTKQKKAISHMYGCSLAIQINLAINPERPDI